MSSAPQRPALTADVIVVGSGATGLPAAIAALDAGATVLIVEANYDVGGHAIQSGGAIAIGGGTRLQQQFSIDDSPEILFADLTRGEQIEYRYNDRQLMRAYAATSASTFEWLIENGVAFHEDIAPQTRDAGQALGGSAARIHKVVWQREVNLRTPTGAIGAGLVRPLEASARAKGARVLLNYRMTSVLRASSESGRVVGITAQYTPKIPPGEKSPLVSYDARGNIDLSAEEITIHADKAVIIATGGHSSNVNFRRIFDPRLTDVYQVVGEPYSYQDASGEIAAMAVGASLWGAANQTIAIGNTLSRPSVIGCRYGLPVTVKTIGILQQLLPDSPIFPFMRATGLPIWDDQDIIMVNQAGLRFWDESDRGRADPYATESLFSAAMNINPASAGPDYPAGPIWAIFDSAAVAREEWDITPPWIDPDGYFFRGDTIEELARNIDNSYQKMPMDPAALQATISRYNSFVDTGHDGDFGKPEPKYRIETGPFYAAFATPLLHDTRAGLRINARAQVIDLHGEVIPGLYCGGESAGGFSQHGLGRCIVQGRIAGTDAAAQPGKER